MTKFLVLVLFLCGCATAKIQKAYDDGYAGGLREGSMICDGQIDALQGGMESLRKSLGICYESLDSCRN